MGSYFSPCPFYHLREEEDCMEPTLQETGVSFTSVRAAECLHRVFGIGMHRRGLFNPIYLGKTYNHCLSPGRVPGDSPAPRCLVAQAAPALAVASSFHWLLFPLMYSGLVGLYFLVLLYFVTLQYYPGSCIYCLSPSLSHFVKELWLLLLENSIKTLCES